jgi:hypothetical protein
VSTTTEFRDPTDNSRRYCYGFQRILNFMPGRQPEPSNIMPLQMQWTLRQMIERIFARSSQVPPQSAKSSQISNSTPISMIFWWGILK